ncbi:MAG: CPBP family intramembrane metalloprotease [Deltaproteobacteria bacterium]|nr:CPBP family intramembrane metalloprotease [Deltaproteobacteria bacterium]
MNDKVRCLRWWHGAVFFAAVLTIQLLLFAAAVLAGSMGLLGRTAVEVSASLFSPFAIAAQVLFTCSVLTGFALTVPRAFGTTARDLLALAPPRSSALVLAAAGVVPVGIVVDEVTFLLHAAAPGLFDTRALDTFSDVFALSGAASFALVTVVVTVGPALGEELFFRGFLLRAFRRDMPATAAIVLSAGLFGVLHLNALQGVGAACIGAYLGFAALATGSLWPAVGAHALNNLLTSVVARLDPSGVGSAAEEGHSVLLLVASLAATAMVVLSLARMGRDREGEAGRRPYLPSS